MIKGMENELEVIAEPKQQPILENVYAKAVKEFRQVREHRDAMGKAVNEFREQLDALKAKLKEQEEVLAMSSLDEDM